MEYEELLEFITKNGLEIQCADGCSSLEYGCGSDPILNPCGQSVICDKDGNKYDVLMLESDKMEELINHLKMNGYSIFLKNDALFVLEDELEYVKTILHEKGITYR